MSALGWVTFAIVPALLLALIVRFTDRNREPLWLVLGTFALGFVFAFVAFFIESRAAKWTGMTIEARVSGEGPALLFLFALVTPLREAAKVAACWPAFRSRHFDEPYDGVVYASASALGFACVENAMVLRSAGPWGLAVARTLLSLPAHVFFACLWGYALGRARQLIGQGVPPSSEQGPSSKAPGVGFPLLFSAAIVGHALYIHLVYGRPSGALVATLPLLIAMGIVTFFLGRDLVRRGAVDENNSFARLSLASIEMLARPPSLSRVRAALRRADRPIMLRWIFFGTFVTIGSMILGLVASIAFAHWAHVDFSIVDEHDVSTTAPVALLGSGLLAAFPLSGFLIARASNLPTLLEPAVATIVAITIVLGMFGMLAPIALVFACAVAPIAFGLACVGAWLGRA